MRDFTSLTNILVMLVTKSHNRGMSLPPIKLNEVKKCSSASLLRSDIGRPTGTPRKLQPTPELDARSLISCTLKYSDERATNQDVRSCIKSELFTKVATVLPADSADADAAAEAFAAVSAKTGESTAPAAVTRRAATVKPEEEIFDIRIFFPNGKAVQFSVEGGALVSASELLDLIAEHLQIDGDVAAETFALWLISPLLEVQLKPHHVAFEVHQKWPVFLRRFAIADEEEIVLDEPLLVIRRNFQLTIVKERMYLSEHERLTEILYLDARDQYLTGRYLLDVEYAVELAALQLAIDFEPYESADRAMDLIQENLGQLVPAQHLSTMRTFRLFGIEMMECKSGMEHEMVDEYRRASNLPNNHERRKAFLDILQATPFYGAAFFTGLRERRTSLLDVLLNPLRGSSGSGANPAASVMVGINHEFITVVNPARQELITCQPIANCSWRRTDESSKCKKAGGEIPLFVLEYADGSTLSAANRESHQDLAIRHASGSGTVSVEFHASDAHDDNGRVNMRPAIRRHSNVESAKERPIVNRQIFSKQAAMMEALLNSVCNELYGKFNLTK